jgi:hypothetical protein
MVAPHHVLDSEKDLRNVTKMRLKRRRPPGNQQTLSHCRTRLRGGQITRSPGKSQRVDARGNGTRRYEDDLLAAPCHAGNNPRNLINTVQVKTAICTRE